MFLGNDPTGFYNTELNLAVDDGFGNCLESRGLFFMQGQNGGPYYYYIGTHMCLSGNTKQFTSLAHDWLDLHVKLMSPHQQGPTCNLN